MLVSTVAPRLHVPGLPVMEPGPHDLLERDGPPQPVALPSLAYHEAGHAVAYLWYGQLVESVTIVPPPETGVAGFCSDPLAGGSRLAEVEGGHRLCAGLTLSAYKAHLLALYAGRAAESLLEGERDAQRAFRGLTGDLRDRQQAASITVDLWPDLAERWRWEGRYRRLALWFVWRYRARIERVAEALLTFGGLSGIEAALAAREGVAAVAEHRRMWAGQDDGQWTVWSAGIARLRAADVPPPRRRTWPTIVAVIAGGAVAVGGVILAVRYRIPGVLLTTFMLSQLFRNGAKRPAERASTDGEGQANPGER